MNTLFAELVNVVFKSGACVLFEHFLEDSQVAFVVNRCTGLEGLEWFNDLHSQPVFLVSDLANYHLVKFLQAVLLQDCQHAIISDLKLIAVRLRELQLRLLLLVETLVILVRWLVAYRLLRCLLRDAVMAKRQRQQKLLESLMVRMRRFK